MCQLLVMLLLPCHCRLLLFPVKCLLPAPWPRPRSLPCRALLLQICLWTLTFRPMRLSSSCSSPATLTGSLAFLSVSAVPWRPSPNFCYCMMANSSCATRLFRITV